MFQLGLWPAGQMDEGEFQERPREFKQLDHWLTNAAKGMGRPAMLLGKRGIGKSQIIKEWLYRNQKNWPKNVFPFYYPFQTYSLEAEMFARSYFSSFVIQFALAKTSKIKSRIPGDTSWENLRMLCEEARSPSLLELVMAVEDASKSGDIQNYIDLVISAPHWLAKLERVHIPVILDHAELMQKVYLGGRSYPLWPHYQQVYKSYLSPHLAAGTRPSLRATLPDLFMDSTHQMSIECKPFDVPDSMAMFKTLVNSHGLEVEMNVAEQIAMQLVGNPFYIHSFSDRVKFNNENLNEVTLAQRLYAEEVTEGGIHWYWRSVLQTHFPSILLRRGVLKLCHALLNQGLRKQNIKRVKQQIEFEQDDFDNMIQLLQIAGILTDTFGSLRLVDDPVMHDVLLTMHWQDLEGMPAQAAVQLLVQQRLAAHTRLAQRAPSQQLLDSLDKLISSFKGQHAAVEWFRFGSPPPPPGFDQRPAEETMIRLPVVVGTMRENVLEPTATPPPFEEMYPPALISFGFYDAKFVPGHQMIWLTAVYANLDSISSDEIETAIRLKEDIQQRFQTPVQYVWIIGGNSFSEEAQVLARKNKMFISNLDMVQRIDAYLSHEHPQQEIKPSGTQAKAKTKPTRTAANTYDIELPIEEDMELLAAQSLEQVARIANCGPEQIAKLKMALVEAALHVVGYQTKAKHKVHVKFEIKDDRLDMSISNITPVEATANHNTNEKLESGVKLMRKLADRMELDQQGQHTSISLTSFLKRNSVHNWN